MGVEEEEEKEELEEEGLFVTNLSQLVSLPSPICFVSTATHFPRREFV